VVIVSGEVTIAELDEAIGYLNDRLKIDQYGNRMDWRKRQTIQEAIDDLLDERLNLSSGGNRENTDYRTIS
jgi:Ribonuclease G/E